MFKLVAKNFLLFHFINICIFSIIYYFLMLNLNKHFVTNTQISSKMYQNNKVINSLIYTVSIESTNGLSDIIPSSMLARMITGLQYFITIIINIGIFIYL
jgi:hypothetical protein